MDETCEREVADLACLHKQITEWVCCPHFPRHTDLAAAVLHCLGTRDPVTRRAVLAATAGRRVLGTVGRVG